MPSIFGNNPYGTLGPSGVRVRKVDLDWGKPVVEIKPPKLSKAEIARAERLQRKYFGGNPYGTLGPSPGRVAKINKTIGRDRFGKKIPPKAPPLTDWEQIQKYAGLLTKQQQDVMNKMLEDSRRQAAAQQASMAGFGAALQGYASDLWGQTAAGYQQAAQAQQSMAAGLGGQMAQGLAEAHAQEAALGGSLGYTGGTDLATPEAGRAQIASEGGQDTGAMMGQVGGAWGGYGATRPDTIGFMTGQNQMQLAREAMDADKETKLEFAQLALENPKTATDMWAAIKSSKREDIATVLAQKTLQTNIALQGAKLRQQYLQMRADAKTDAQKLAADKWWRQQQIILDQQSIGIAQQNADTAGLNAQTGIYRAETGRINANKPPDPGTPEKYSTGDYGAKVSSAMGAAPTLFSQHGGNAQQRANYAFNILWGQMSRYVNPANKKQAKDLLLQRLRKSAKQYVQKTSAGGWGGGNAPGQ